MFFSNLIAYRFKQDAQFDQTQFEQALAQDKFRPCAAQDLSTFGWSNALGKYASTLSHFSANKILVCAKREEKVLPPTVINDLLAAKIDEIELTQHRPVKKKEKDELKENLIHSLLPQAFTKSSFTFAFIDMAKGWLVVNTTSFNKAEELLALLRKSLGSLPVVPAFVNHDLGLLLTKWLSTNQAPEQFAIGFDAELVEPEEKGAKVVLKQLDLTADEIQTHLHNGKVVTKLSLDWQERISFTLQEDGAIKRLAYAELLKEENADIPKEDMAHKLDADFILVTSDLILLLEQLTASLGEPESV